MTNIYAALIKYGKQKFHNIINNVDSSNLATATLLPMCLLLIACESEPNPQRQSQLKIETSTSVDLPADTVELKINLININTGAYYSLTSLDSPLLVKWNGSEAILNETTNGSYEASFTGATVGNIVIETEFETSTFRKEHMVSLNSHPVIIESGQTSISNGELVAIQWFPSNNIPVQSFLENLDIELLPIGMICGTTVNLIDALGDGLQAKTEVIDENTLSTFIEYSVLETYLEERGMDRESLNNCQIEISLKIATVIPTEDVNGQVASNKFANVLIHGSLGNIPSDTHSIKLVSQSSSFNIVR